MASMAMRGPPLMARGLGLSLGRDDFAAVIVAASRAQIVRKLQFAAVRAFLERRGLQRVMAAAHVPLGRRGFSLGDSHCGTFECLVDNNKNCDDLRLVSAGYPQAAPGSSRTAAPIANEADVASQAAARTESATNGLVWRS